MGIMGFAVAAVISFCCSSLSCSFAIDSKSNFSTYYIITRVVIKGQD